VAFDHYGKEWGQHYQDPLWAALGVPKQNGEQQMQGDRANAAGKKRAKPKGKAQARTAQARRS
jgi:hypothetical protein